MKKTLHTILATVGVCFILSTTALCAFPPLANLGATTEEKSLLEKYRVPCYHAWGQYLLSFATQKSLNENKLHHLAGDALYILKLHQDKSFYDLVKGRMDRAQDRNPESFQDELEGRDLAKDFRAIMDVIKSYDHLHVDALIDETLETYACYRTHRKKWGYEESVSLVGIGSGTGNY